MRLLIVAAMAALLTGCATHTDYEYVVDAKYVDAVNRGARIGGGQVHWVHYPTIRQPVAQQPAS
ncbi:hypothetical protein QWZ03_15785 [Chitinimonas viridis]|uniref:Lipoprotein n=2 Tax=Chitinimonas TaxID=240411 RepID=A0ABT8B7J4_9NEIS|nr:MULTISPECIES: hypothetical protein [Chitinimonas]MDN3578229.1 hypothetical protein [Chitinimonas viridis]GLR12112.1 hypothetical protein GCM10007907_09020 [Chitinimonas prasina]